jgi:hypothetical protein
MTTETGSTSATVGVGEPQPGATDSPWSNVDPHAFLQLPFPPVDAPPAGGYAIDAAGQPRRPSRSIVLITIAVVVAVALAVSLSLQGPSQTGSGRNTITVPSTPPAALLGQHANGGALQQNSEWSTLASQVASTSTVSFASVYGPYPPANLPTTDTFLVVAGEPNGGNTDIPSLMHQEMSGVRSSLNGQPGAKVTIGPLQHSVLGGQMQCVSAVVFPAVVGECLWLNPQALVQVVTFNANLGTVGGMTEQVVNELHGGPAVTA